MKGVFDQDLGDMLEVDHGLDINEMLASIPAIETEVDKTKPLEKEKEVKDKDGEEKTPSLKNINEVLEKQSKAIEEDTKKVNEVVEVGDKKDDEAPGTNEQTTETSSDAPFTVIFAKDLVAQGLLSSFDETEFAKESKELGEAVALRNLIKSEIDTNVEAAKADLDTGYQEYLGLVGKGVPADTAGDLLSLKKQFDSIKVDDLAKEDNVAIRKEVMTNYYKLTTSMSDAKITKLVQSSIDLGDDIEDSKENLDTLKNLVRDQISAEEQEAQRQASLRKEENRRVIESLKESINTIEEVIPGVGINKQTKVKMFEALTKEVQDNKGRVTNALWARRAEDPVFFDSRLAYLYETGFFDKGKSWTKASQAKTTKEVTNLEKAIESRKNTLSTTGTSVLRSPEIDKTAKDNIDAMRGIFER
jgi:hypothetical protein